MMEWMFNKVRRSKFFNSLLCILRVFRLDMLCIRAMYKWFEKHPTEDMKKSRRYFEARRDNIAEIENLLADDKSRKVWRQLLSFRATMNYKYHPGMEDEQYFVKGIISLNEEEVFIDCGGYDGQTSIDFINQVDNNFRKIVIFEPDSRCLSMISEKIPNDERIRVIPKGVWSKEDSLNFVSGGVSDSHVMRVGEDVRDRELETISVISMDKCEDCKDATFIKMDLEGAEQKALRGAEEIIRRNMPKLAICIYHSDQDMIEIIEYVHKLVPEYRLYVRHHSSAQIETVLYAVL